ncbi:helix-turn-helix domain-containing protein [Paenibacillus sp. YIM B09110]|uniref:helix-turn-helix domain-containing protein n=1 Tax=Paenibacillus sp. YIM B09110 TaxID=3126102 RepID=UPI00301DAA2B
MRSADREEYLRTSCKLLQESIQLPVCYALMHSDHIHAFTVEEILSNPFFANKPELIRFLMQQVQHYNVPNIHTTNFGESFIILPLIQDGVLEATIFIGPAITIRMNDEIIFNKLSELNIKATEEWTSYLKQLPLLSSKRLYHIGILANHLLNGVILDVTDIIETHYRFGQPVISKKEADIVISDRRESLEFRGLFEIEKQLLSSIRNGDKTAFYNMTLSTNYDGPGILSNYNKLRNIKNLGIYVTALAARASIEGGLYPEIAYTLSDLHIQNIEELRDYHAVVNAIGEALIDFVDRVSRSKRKHLSKSIATCQEYIFNHLYENTPLSILADIAGLQENYLSQLFKKETGVTITQFIQQEKVEEAKKLLELTSEPVTAVAAKLNFFDQNHFIKIFKRYTGLTPKKYRDKNKFDVTHD